MEKSGGLMLLWNDSSVVNIRSFSKGHIDARIQDNNSSWRFTGFYGNPRAEKRVESWELLERLNDNAHESWIIGGDFNEILSDKEKDGGA